MTTTIPDLNDLARYRPEIADLTERVRARDLGAIDRAREVLNELDAIATQLGADFVEATPAMAAGVAGHAWSTSQIAGLLDN